MSTIHITAEELLTRAVELAKKHRSLEIMDSSAILHGYIELRRSSPNDDGLRRDVEAAAANLLDLTDRLTRAA